MFLDILSANLIKKAILAISIFSNDDLIPSSRMAQKNKLTRWQLAISLWERIFAATLSLNYLKDGKHLVLD